MPQASLYLRPNVVVEPLVDSWYAWAHLIPPHTAARNITERHLRIMDSFLANPGAHVAAVRDPKLRGGPFIDLPEDRAGEIQALRDRTVRERRPQIELSEAIAALDGMLQEKATGFGMEPLYAEVPAPLQGYVELVYDLNHRPSARFIEPLLYRGRHYDRSMQSLALSLTSGDDRPFVLSTPRLPADDVLHLPVHFDDPAIDELFRAKTQAANYEKLREMLRVPAAAEGAFRSLFTEEAPSPYEPYRGERARWRYFGHACILLETKKLNVLLDPVLSYTYESDVSRYTYQDLPDRIDYVLITHNHQDHILFETLLQLRHKIRNILVPRSGGGALQDPSLKMTLEACGFRNVREIGEMDSIPVEDGSITAIPFLGEHGDLDVRTKTGYLVRTGGHSLMFAADSCNISPCLYRHVEAATGNVDVLFLGMECDGAPVSWLYGPLFSRRIDRKMDHSRRLAGSNFERAIHMADEFHCKEVYVYAMGQEPWLNYVMSIKYTEQSNPIVQSNQLVKVCQERGLASERLFGEREILLG